MFWQTWDEPAHIGAGMEWVARGQYTYDPMEGPLARIMSAAVLYAGGVDGSPQATMWDEGNRVLRANDAYERNLTLARIGILPFFVTACIAVVLWAKACGGGPTTLAALLLFSTLPPVLAHSGLATLDMPCSALVAAALLAFTSWLRHPGVGTSARLGLLSALASLTKATGPAFLGAAGVLMAAVDLMGRWQSAAARHQLTIDGRRWMATAPIALVVAGLVTWACYRFSVAPWYAPEDRPHETVDGIVGSEGALHDLAYSLVEHVPVPAPEMWLGIREAWRRLEWADDRRPASHRG